MIDFKGSQFEKAIILWAVTEELGTLLNFLTYEEKKKGQISNYDSCIAVITSAMPKTCQVKTCPQCSLRWCECSDKMLLQPNEQIPCGKAESLV